MLNKIKNITGKAMFLALMLIVVIMPKSVYAGTYEAIDWDEYKEKLKIAIMKQDGDIVINYNGNEVFSTEYFARLKIANVYEEALKDIPKYLGELNVLDQRTIPELDGVLNAQLKKVTHRIKYKNSFDEFTKIKSIISKEYDNIKSQVTDYEKLKTVYDYIVIELKNTDGELSKLLSPLEGETYEPYPNAVLFALMMSEIGYENDIAIGDNGHKWNLVKVHGKWYHVDASKENVNAEGKVEDKYFLIAAVDQGWNKNYHGEKTFDEYNYNGNPPTVPQIEYEITLIKNGMPKEADVNNIPDVVTIDDVKDTKEKVKQLETKIADYLDRIMLLKAQVKKLGLGVQEQPLIDKLDVLKSDLNTALGELNKKKETIVNNAVIKAESTFDLNDISIAKEVSDLLTDSTTKEKIIALEDSILAIKKAENTKLASDINLAKESTTNSKIQDLKEKLEEIIKVLEATIAVEKAETTMDDDDIEIANDLIFGLKDGEAKDNLNARLTVVKEKKEANETEQGNINTANLAVKVAEEIIKTSSDIDEIETKITNAINLLELVKTESIKTQLQARIKDVETAKDVIKLVNDADSLDNVPSEGSLSTIIKESEEKVEIAENGIKDIKDREVKTNQQNRIRKVKVVITALKAVEKAETTPLKISNVNSAKTAIAKIDDSFAAIIIKLTDRLKIVEENISNLNIITKALTSVEKAEKSLITTDIALAKEAIELLRLEGEIKFATTIGELNTRINATEKMLKMENDLIKYLKDFTEGDKAILEGSISDVKTSFGTIPDGSVKTSRRARVIVIDNIMIACGKIEEAIDNLSDANIKAAEDAIANITDSKVKKELETKLKNLLAKVELDKKINEAKEAVSNARTSLITTDLKLEDNKIAIELANVAVNKLPTGNIKKELQDKVKDYNYVIKAKEAIENAEAKGDTLIARDITTIENAIKYIKDMDGLGYLSTRLEALKDNLMINESLELIKKAEEAVKKANETKSTNDILAAKNAIKLVKDDKKRAELTKKIEDLEVQIAKDAMIYAESTKLSKDIATAKKAIDAISIKVEYGEVKTNLNNRVKAMESYLATINILVNAEKNKNAKNYDDANTSLAAFEKVVESVAEGDIAIYTAMVEEIKIRIKAIETHLVGEEGKVTNAEAAVKVIEGQMKVDLDPENTLIQEAQKLVDLVNDKNIKAGLQKRINAIQLAKDAKIAVMRAEAYTNDKSVKDAESALSKVDGRYSDIIQDLSERILKLKNQLDISKKVDEATKLVQKAVDSRKKSDSIIARFAVDELEFLAPTSYAKLIEILTALDTSIGSSEKDEADALKAVNDALNLTFDFVDKANTLIIGIIEGQENEKEKIQEGYGIIESAKIEIIKANAAVRRLSEQKGLLSEIDYANKVIASAEDSVDIKEAVRLVTVASTSVGNANTDMEKSKARLDIAAARRAIDKIDQPNNKAIKATILNTVNAIEKKLESDNDQELIDLAVKAVNKAADMLAKAVSDESIKDKTVQEDINKAIFAAKMAIGWISDNNKAAKVTLTGFLDDIAAMFTAEKDGILNEDRIKNAEAAVKLAEDNKGSELLQNYIRSARLRVKMINNDGPETAVIINDLNTRLDILEGKGGSGGNGGNSGSGGNNKPGGGNSGSNKPGGGTSTGNTIPTTPLPDKDRFIGTTAPIWGKTNELNKKNPVTGISAQTISAFRVMESKMKIIELSNILKPNQHINAKLVVSGKNINLDSKPYIHDKVNNSILVPIKALGDELGFSVSLINSPAINGAKRLSLNGLVDGKPKSIVMDLGSEYCYVNGNLVKLNSKPVIQEGRTYIPVDFMVEHFGLTFNYYNDGKNIQLIIN